MRSYKFPSLKSFIKFFLDLLIALGCCFQIETITSTYFKYETKTETKISRGKVVLSPSVSLCWSFFDLLDIENLNAKSDKNFRRPFSLQDEDEILSVITIKDIFEQTPPNSSIIDSCFVRIGNTFSSKTLSSAECDQEFIVKKYFHREFICYHFEMRKLTKFSMYQTLYTANYPGRFFAIELAPEIFSNTSSFSPTVHSPGTSITFDTSLSYYFHRPLNATTGETVAVKIMNSFFTIDTKRLPPPYDTNCMKSLHTNTHKILACLDDFSYGDLGKITGSQIIWDPVEKHLLTRAEAKNHTTELDWFLEQCKDSIRQLACERYHTSTETQVSEDSDKLLLTVEWPKNPDFEIISYPRNDFIELIIYIMSSIGIWCGVSIISMSHFLVEKVRSVFENQNGVYRKEPLTRTTKSRSLKHERAKSLLQFQFLATRKLQREMKDLQLIVVLNDSLKGQ